MKIILSPSKLQKADHPINPQKLLFRQDKTRKLYSSLRQMTLKDIKLHFKLSDERAKNLYDIFKHQVDDVYAPFDLYSGIVFKEIDPNYYDDIQRDYFSQHGIVLSALYGIIEPTMGIWPYRLDFTRKLNTLNLYDYWSKDILTYFENEDIVVNLASAEFSKLLKGYKGHMLNIHFKDEKEDGTLKIITTSAKKMRGMMFNYMCEHCIEDIKQLKQFDENDYCYKTEFSDETNYVYVKAYN